MRRGDKPCQYLVMNRMAVDLNVLGAFIEGQNVGNEDSCLIIIIHGHGFPKKKTTVV